MYDAVVNCCNSNSAIVATVPAFQASQNELAAKATAIRTAIQDSAKIITGVAMGKTEQQKDLARQAANISAAVCAFASASGNIGLKQEMKYRPSASLALVSKIRVMSYRQFNEAI